MDNSQVKAVILAAGVGSRLSPHTDDRPKCLVEVDGVSLLDRHLAVLRSQGINSIVLVGGYLSEMLERPNTKLVLNPRYSETNMVWTLFSAEEELEGDIIIAYGDIVYSRSILEALLASDADIAVTIDMEWEAYWRARNEDPLDDAETLKMHADGRIYEIGRKPKSLEEIEGQYMGLIKLSSQGVHALKTVFYEKKEEGTLYGRPIEKAYMTDLLQALIDSGHDIHSVPIRDSWVEVDTAGDLGSIVTKERLRDIECSP